MQGGYNGKVLFVDLASASITVRRPEESTYRKFLGGVGLGVRILYEAMHPATDPLGPENWLGFVPGLLTGTRIPMTGRHMVVTKSPLTGTWCDSNSGGYFGVEIKRAGYDGVFIDGASRSPVYLLIDGDEVDLKEASHLWGADTTSTVDILHDELEDPDIKIACIGPSGEARSLLASIVNDKTRLAGRGGVGAVMGAKLLKAVAVKGKREVPVADSKRVGVLRREFIDGLKSSPFHNMLKNIGTAGGFSGNIVSGATPIKNWTLIGEGGMPHHSRIGGEEVIKYQVRRDGCYGCPIFCGGIVKVGGAPYGVENGKKPEYETIAAFGAMCLNDNLESIIKANDICNLYGMDTISAGATMAFAIECYEKGLVNKSDCNGIELSWGNGPAIIAMLERMARREGFGAILADGVERASERIGRGAERYAVHIHGQEPAYHDPRIFPGRGTMYVSDANPGRHTVGALAAALDRGAVLGQEPAFQVEKQDKYDNYHAKGPLYSLGSAYFQAISAAGLCLYGSLVNTISVADFTSAVTGWEFSADELLKAGRRIQTLRQCFNYREGLKPGDFSLPERLHVAASMGPYAGVQVDFDATKRSYYAAMGWDLTTGRPYQRTLDELGLGELAGDISESGPL